MTANYTKRLNLMQPQNSDTFTPADFSASFANLDRVPGITPVPDYKSLPVGLDFYHHGSTFLQLDNQAMWMWNRASASVNPGSWVRVNSIGRLGSIGLPATVWTQKTDSKEAGYNIMSIHGIKIPGGRPLAVSLFIGSMRNTGSGGIGFARILENGGVVAQGYMNSDKGNGTQMFLYHHTGTYGQGTNFDFDVEIRGYSGTGGGGTTYVDAGYGSELLIYEI